MEKDRYFKEINIARGIGVLIVLLGHSFPDAELGVFPHFGYRWVYDFCYAFHMALFFVISGFVMGRKFFDGGHGFRREALRKIKRLLIPYLFLSYASLLPKILWNAYARNPVDEESVWRVLLGRSPNGSLWYLYTLFVFSLYALLIASILRRAGDGVKIVCVILPAVVLYAVGYSLGEEFLQHIYLERIFRYFLYYSLGIIIYAFYGRVKAFLHPIPGGMALLAVGGLACPLVGRESPYLVTALSGTYGILALALYLSGKKGKLRVFFDLCGERSYDIYIFSYYIQQSVRVLLYREAGWEYPVVLLLELFGGFGLSLLLSLLIRRSKLLKALFTGEWSGERRYTGKKEEETDVCGQ